MLIGYFAEYKGYRGTIKLNPQSGYYGSVQLSDSFCQGYGSFQRVEDMYKTFTKCVDEYLSRR